MLLVVSLVLSITGAEVYHDQLQLPWRRVLMGFAIDTVFALPLGVLVATANQVNSSWKASGQHLPENLGQQQVDAYSILLE